MGRIGQEQADPVALAYAEPGKAAGDALDRLESLAIGEAPAEKIGQHRIGIAPRRSLEHLDQGHRREVAIPGLGMAIGCTPDRGGVGHGTGIMLRPVARQWTERARHKSPSP
jgi:hypothetical protein